MVNQYYLGDPGRAHRYIITGNPSSAWLKKEFYLDFIFLCTGSRLPYPQKGDFIPTHMGAYKSKQDSSKLQKTFTSPNKAKCL